MTAVLRPLLFAFLFFLAGATASCARSDGLSAKGEHGRDLLVIETASGEHRFQVEFADSDEERRTGLMYRSEMAADAGMLFDFGDEPQPISMWMKNTLIPLDMAFIDKDGVIRRIAPMTTPRSLESIPSGAPVVAVLEVNGGVFETLGVKTGDRVRHKMFEKR
ncbi:MAG: DUF192 domain-containing protein [Parvularculaceae bacterium]